MMNSADKKNFLSGKSKFRCNVCGQGFRSLSALEQHLEEFPLKVKCDDCRRAGFQFYQRYLRHAMPSGGLWISFILNKLSKIEIKRGLRKVFHSENPPFRCLECAKLGDVTVDTVTFVEDHDPKNSDRLVLMTANKEMLKLKYVSIISADMRGGDVRCDGKKITAKNIKERSRIIGLYCDENFMPSTSPESSGTVHLYRDVTFGLIDF